MIRSAEEFVAELRALAGRYWGTHPFHQRMHAGELSRDELRTWAANRWYYQSVRPRKDAAIIANCPPPEIRRAWLDRIVHHDGRSDDDQDSGRERWLRLCEAVGLTRDEVLSERHVVPGVQFAVDAYVTFARTRRPVALRRAVHSGGDRDGARRAVPGRARAGRLRGADQARGAESGGMDVTVAPPLGMLAELTHRCPLHCPYCSNPVELTARADELTTYDWLAVLDEARDIGVLQVHLSGGEPLARPDLPALVAHAADLGCYVNLVTSGLGLTRERLADLVDRGLAHVQLSVQGADAARADRIAGARAHEHKLTAAALVKAAELPLTVNVVLHRENHDVGALIALAERMGADRLELANTQYYGWALRNRAALMPTPAQLAAAEPVVRAATERLRGTMEIVYVVADYYERYPKPCMYGWGARQLTVAPNGDVLPCPAASVITTLPVENVRTRPLRAIWYDSESFNAYRGEEWMREPCRTCARRSVDFGGCRCQAFQLLGDAAATDPVCSRSPDRGVVDLLLPSQGERPAFVMRDAASAR